jgi:hypothetical protein
MGKTNFFLSTLPLGNFSHMAACRSSLENIGKMNFIPVLNKTSPKAHTELELDVLDGLGKLVTYVVHLSKKNLKKKYLSSYKLHQPSTSFWSQGILGVILDRGDYFLRAFDAYGDTIKKWIIPQYPL